MCDMNRRAQSGEVSASLIVSIFLGVFVVVLGGLSVFFYLQYAEQRRDVDGKVDQAVADAKKVQQDEFEKRLIEELEKPYATYSGPGELGNIEFQYPKTWSTYIHDSGRDGKTLEVYLNPGKVSPVDDEKSKFAIRMSVLDQQYDEVLAEYTDLIQEGELKSSVVKANGQTGTRITGRFDEGLRATAVYFQMREKTLEMRTDATQFRGKFDEAVKTLKFNI